MARKKSLKKSRTRSKKYRAPCKRTKYSCSKSGGMFKYLKSLWNEVDDSEDSGYSNPIDDPEEVERYVKEREEREAKEREEKERKEAKEKEKKEEMKRKNDEEKKRNEKFHKISVKSTGEELHSSLAYNSKGKKSKGGKSKKSKKSKKCKGGKRKKTKRRSSKRGG